MKIKDFERVIFTPGLCRQSLTSDYYEVENTVVVGTTGSGKSTLMQAIAKSIIDSNDASQFNLAYFDMYDKEESPLCNPNRIMPCMQIMKCIREEAFACLDYNDRVSQFLAYLPMLAKFGMSTVDEDEYHAGMRDSMLIVIIDGFDKLGDFYRDAVFATMKLTNRIKFILGLQSSVLVRDYLDLIPYRIVTRAHSPKDSDKVLGCNLGYTQADAWGTCWFKDERNPFIYKKYEVEYIPNSFLNRVTKVYASGYKNTNSIVVDYENMLYKMNTYLEWIKELLQDKSADLARFVYYILSEEGTRYED